MIFKPRLLCPKPMESTLCTTVQMYYDLEPSSRDLENILFDTIVVLYFILLRGFIPAGGGDDDDEEDDGGHHTDDDHHLDVLPPVLTLQLGRLNASLYGIHA